MPGLRRCDMDTEEADYAFQNLGFQKDGAVIRYQWTLLLLSLIFHTQVPPWVPAISSKIITRQVDIRHNESKLTFSLFLLLLLLHCLLRMHNMIKLTITGILSYEIKSTLRFLVTYPPDKPKYAFIWDKLQEMLSPLDSLTAWSTRAQAAICAPADCPIR